MKTVPSNSFRRLVAVCCAALAGLAVTPALSAQTAVSNLGQPVTGSANIGTQGGGESWRRTFSFTTGANAGGYDFSGITFSFTNGSGTPNPLDVQLFSTFDANTVAGGGNLLSALSLSSGNPLSAGNSVYTGTVSLNASSTYFLMLSAGPAIAPGNNYTYQLPTTYAEDIGGLDGWTIGDGSWISSPTSTWSSNGSLASFSVQASAVPEPATSAVLLAGFVLSATVLIRRPRRAD